MVSGEFTDHPTLFSPPFAAACSAPGCRALGSSAVLLKAAQGHKCFALWQSELQALT